MNDTHYTFPPRRLGTRGPSGDSAFTQAVPDLSTQLLRAEFLAGPPERQRETLQRVRRALAEERQRRGPKSALWKLAWAVYGVKPEEC